jgi:hypothetical protein
MSHDVVRDGILGVMTANHVIVGAAVLIEDGHIITCDHVVQAAVDPKAAAEGKSVSATQATVVLVCFPQHALTPLKAQVVKRDEREDLAVLRFVSAENLPSTAAPVRFVNARHAKDKELRAFGFPNNSPVGATSRFRADDPAGRGWQQLKPLPNDRLELQPGFSGTAVLFKNDGGPAVGIVVATHSKTPTDFPVAYMIPTAKLIEFWPPLATAPPFPPAYRDWLIQECRKVSLLGMQARGQGQSVVLRSVYVPLTTPQSLARKDGADDAPARPPAPREGQELRPTLLIDLLGQYSLGVAGHAGTGKSTFCAWLALILCENSIPQHKIPPPEGFTEQLADSLRGRLPLLIRLRGFWDFLRPEHAGVAKLSQHDFESALARWVAEGKSTQGMDWATLDLHLQSGTALVMFDGVDEVPRSVRQGDVTWNPRRLFLTGLSETLASWRAAGNRVLVTGRKHGLTEDEAKLLGLPLVALGDLPRPLQLLLAHRWFASLEDNRELGQEIAKKMLDDIAARRELQEMAANPLFLTAMCIIYGNEKGRLPQDKYELYDKIVDAVLYSHSDDDPNWGEQAREQLAFIAHGMHTGENLGERRSVPQAEVTDDELDQLLAAHEQQDTTTGPGFRSVQQLRNRLLESGLLVPKDGATAEFFHFSFQEFLAAQRLVTEEGAKLAMKAGDGVGQVASIFELRARAPEWHNTLCFFFSALLDNNITRRHLPTLVDLLFAKTRPLDGTDSPLRLQVVLADCLQTYRRKLAMKDGVGQQEQQLKPEWSSQLIEICLAAIQRRAPITDRHFLGLCLGELGDPRIVEDLRDRSKLDGLGRSAWVEVPAREYKLGDEEESDNPPRTFTLPEPIWLTRYPITNSQYALFIADGGYNQRESWSEEGWKWREVNGVTEPEYWREAKWNGKNQPVVGVSWYEAEAFARWAGARLPSEWEWEAAARGPQGYTYPWADEWTGGRCNSAEANLGVTSAVGLFPDGASQPNGPEGDRLDDMAGNVWEWCADWYDERASSRVLRGGSWYAPARSCRSAHRFRYTPDFRDDYLGFRVALVQQAELGERSESK